MSRSPDENRLNELELECSIYRLQQDTRMALECIFLILHVEIELKLFIY